MQRCGDNMYYDEGSINLTGNHIGFESFELKCENTRNP